MIYLLEAGKITARGGYEELLAGSEPFRGLAAGVQARLSPAPLTHRSGRAMRSFTAIIERDRETGLYVGYVPGLPGAHSQAATIDELRDHLVEVIQLVLEEGPRS